MKKSIALLILLSSYLSPLFCGYSHGQIRDNQGRFYTFSEYRSNDLIEYDQYKQQQASADAAGFLVVYLMAAGIKKAVVISRDSSIGDLLKEYTFTKHHKYMSALAESTTPNKNHKTPLITLFNNYYSYRKFLDEKTLKQIHKFKKPKIKLTDINLDLAETPYIKNKTIEAWVCQHYQKEPDQTAILNIIYEYKTNRLASDRELNAIYFNILKS